MHVVAVGLTYNPYFSVVLNNNPAYGNYSILFYSVILSTAQRGKVEVTLSELKTNKRTITCEFLGVVLVS